MCPRGREASLLRHLALDLDMPLFRKRHTGDDAATPPPPLDIGWCHRLGAVGDALDGTGEPFVDVAIVTDGPSESSSALINTLGYQTNLYNSGFNPMMFRLEPPADEPVVQAASDPETAPVALTPQSFGSWGGRLRGVGHILDVVEPAMSSPTILDLEDGVVVTALLPSPKLQPAWLLYTFEYSNKQIRNALKAAVESTNAVLAAPGK